MRYMFLVMLVCIPNANAQTPDAIIQRAISAHGGSESLAKMKAVIVTSKGKANFGGPEVEGTRDSSWALPDRVLWTLEFPRDKLKTTLAVNGLSGWQKVNTTPASDMSPPAYDTMIDDAYAYWLATVLPLTRKDLVFAVAPDGTIDSQPAFGIKVTKPNRPEATLYFSKSNGLLMKVAYKGREAGVPVPKEIVLSNHKTFDGVKLPTKIVDITKGAVMGDWQVANYKFVDKFDATTFKKP